MKFVLAAYGSRGDVEPSATVGLELLRRGHDVRMAVSPNMLDFVESTGLTAVAYGPDSQALLNDENFVRNLAQKIQNPIGMLPEVIEHVNRVCAEKTTVLTSLADGADLILAGYNEQGVATNVADYYRIPLAALHLFPVQIWSSGGLYSRISKMAEDAQRRALSLPTATEAALPAVADLGSLEVQAYDEVCLPALAGQWPQGIEQRHVVGALTLQLPTDADDEVLAWIAAGTAPIYFGFGSTPITPFADTVAMISAACAQLGERALISSGPNDVSHLTHSDHVKIVSAINHAAVFPACRMVVHHGGAGTTAAGMRAGVPTLVLWLWLDQPIWAGAVTALKVGAGRAFSATTEPSLIADLRALLAPRYLARARAVAAEMTTPAASGKNAADLVERSACRPN